MRTRKTWFALLIWTASSLVSLQAWGQQTPTADRIAVMANPDTTLPRNQFYAGNKEPLLPSPLIKLPLGAIKPQGWLRKQLELEADGYVGHLMEISGFCKHENNAWLSADGEGTNGWEEVPYWLRGFAALGYVLEDKRVMDETKLWIETAIASQLEDGYFGPRANITEPFVAIPAEWFQTADGKPGLAGEYFSDTKFATPKFQRIDPNIDFAWGRRESRQGPVEVASPFQGLDTKFSARWSGKLVPAQSGEYSISTLIDGPARLTLDGQVVFDSFAKGHRESFTRKPLRLEKGKPIDLKLECVQDGGGRRELRLAMRGKFYTGKTTPDLMPNMSMMYALRANYEYTGDKRILDLLTRYFKWQLTIPDKHFFAGGWQVPRNGDNMDSIYWLYNITGEKFLLELADKCRRCGASWMKEPTGCHNVDFSQGFRKPAQFYPQNKDPLYLEQAEKNWMSIINIYGQVPGGMFAGDEFARPGYIDPRQAIETCGIVDAMLSHQILLQISGDLKWAERCENAAYNSLPAAMTADLKALRYLTSPNQICSDARNKGPELADGGDMQGMNPHSHRCCQHNSGMGWPYFAQNLWQATPGNGLAAIFYSACQVKAKVGSGELITITQETHYPFDGAVEFKFDCAAPVQFPLSLRVPAWCSKPQVAINGTPVAVDGKPLTFILIDRKWAKGDTLTLKLPMEVTVTTWAKNKNSASVNLGPLTFSLKIGEKYTKYAGTETWPAWEIHPTTPWNYGLAYDAANLASSFQVVKKPWPASNMVFTHEGSPVEIKARGKSIPNWKEDGLGLVGLLQPSTVKSPAPVEDITLVPMGACRIRISAFPVIGDGPQAREWTATAPAYASFWSKDKDFEALHDGRLPSEKNAAPLFGWVGWAGAGTGQKHWLREDLDKPATISSCELYWVFGQNWFTTPEWWKLYYNCGEDQWKEVELEGGAPELRTDGFTRITFKPVKTSALKIEAQTRRGKSCGFYEWRLWAQDGGLIKHTVRRSFGVDLMGNAVKKSLSNCEITWFKDPQDAKSQLPRSVKLFYRVGDDWKPIADAQVSPIVEGKPTTVKFAKVEAEELKMEVIADPNASAGPKDWLVR